MRILWIGYFRQTPYGDRTDDDRLASALVRAGADVQRCEAPWPDLESELSRQQPDWAIFSKCHEFSPARLARLRAAHPTLRCAQVLFDLMDYSDRRVPGIPWFQQSRLEWWLPFARQIDLIFMKERGDFDRYAREGVRCVYLDQACDIDEGPVEPPADATINDISFFGSLTPPRAHSLLLLNRDRRVVIHAQRGRPWQRLGLDVRPAVYGTDFAVAIASSRIVYGESVTLTVDGYWSDRLFRTLGRKGFLLTRYTLGLEQVFENHKHLVWAQTDEELTTQAARYLADADARQRIREAGFRHVRAHHTYDHRARELLQTLSQECAPARARK